MTQPPTSSGEGDPGQVTRIAEEFIRLHEAGQLTDLDEFCGRYPEDQRQDVRQECEQLLRIHGVIKQPDRLTPGQTLGSFKIVEQIGRGGMGEVYRARDSKLDRDIAIKILPPELACQPERVKRFEREAKAIAALDHPNIVTIHSVEESDGLHFITMQLVQGKTLSELIPRKGFALEKFFDLAIPLADAISNAHDQGITHRDLKPANIMVTAEGRVEILDFGLAKLRPQATAEGPTQMPLSSLTIEGQIVGTVAYMSPEQAEGRDVDHRTDIFSLGIILYEMVTGQRPFKGETRVALMSSIMKDTPTTVCALNPHVPNHLGRIIRRTLEKDSERRFQTSKDLRNELEALKREVSSGEVEVGAAGDAVRRRVGGSSRRRFPLTLGACVVTALAAVFATIVLTGESRPRDPLADAKYSKITNFEGTEFDPAISPDGKFVAFVSDRDGPFDLLVGQIGGGDFDNRTRGRFPVWIERLRDVGFNADGSQVWVGGGAGRRMQSIPLIGGQFSNFMEEDVVNVDWTRDGSRAVYHTRQSGDPFYVAEPNASAGDPILVEDAGYHQHYPIWSFDEQWIYLVRGRPTTGDMDLWRVRPDGRDAKRLTFDKKFVAYPTPIDEVTVLYVAREIDGSGPWLWALDTETETSRRVTSGLAQYTSVSASEDGRRLVVTRADPQASLWRVPILRDGIATESDVSSFSEVPSLRALAPRIREAHIFYLSSGPRGDVLWRVGDSKAVEVRSPGHSLLWPPSISPDGTSVALALREESRMSLHLISSDGAWSERLSDEIDVRGTSSWSPKGDWIVVGGDDGNGAGLFKIRVSDGTAERIATGEAMNPVWSPVDDLIVYAGLQVNTFSPLVAIQSDGEPVELPPIEVRRGGERFRFLPNGRGLVYMQGLQHAQDFWLLDLTTKKERRLTRLEGVDSMRTFDITPDGETIVFDRLRQNSDIVLIELGNESEAAGKH